MWKSVRSGGALLCAALLASAPDVFRMNGPNFQLYASNGVIRPIEEQSTTRRSSTPRR
ncbi:hypothetical protein AB0L05_25080 [Nonomuraea pusilla]|uniref:hypothetical protein n=1 Tax=Nonomuraea pusilla TaxID=46177 RepID=UPI00331CFE9D